LTSEDVEQEKYGEDEEHGRTGVSDTRVLPGESFGSS